MSIFKRLFGKKPDPGRSSVPPLAASKQPTNSAAVHCQRTDATPPSSDPAKDPNLIRVHDAYGREMFITKQQWREGALLGNLEQNRDRPDDLANIIVQSLHDGFAADVLPFAARLATIDPNPERGHVLYAVTLLELKRFAEAETVLLRFMDKHDESGVALTNLAKAYSGRGDGLDALRRVAALPGAWRARLWLARDRLEQRDLPAALALYREALDLSPSPVPSDLLRQMSGDLGSHAHLPELLQLAEPRYDATFHGLSVGNNLIKANLDLGRIDAARVHLERLYAQNRPDWKHHLSFWDTEIGKARIAIADAPSPEKLEVTLLSILGPVWLPPATPAAELFPAKPSNAPVVAFIGGSAEMASATTGSAYRLQLADGPGRLSRALPLYLAEQVEFGTEATTCTLVPWIVKPATGFVLGGNAWSDAEAAAHARSIGPEQTPADYIVITHLRCTAEPWRIELRLVRAIDAKRLAETTATCPAADPVKALPSLTADLLAALAAQAQVRSASPSTSDLPSFAPSLESAYLVRLEQLLAVRTAGMDPTRTTLNGERDILDGHLDLCLHHPASVSIRVLFAQTLRGMKKVRPDILSEYRARVDLLQREKPLPEPAQSVLARIFAEAFPT